ncbi:MAG: enoyl-CoA hydratase/isomerase family protein [Streptosporangiales bacterium]|nr:enoyl-CoA hydratase/isomerase family protein [Streptosporangiales bacterium]
MSVDVTMASGIAEITLNRPDAMNAIDPQMRARLREVWRQLDEDPDIAVAILTGAGDRAFCTGSDLKRTPPPPQSYAELTFGSGESTHLLAGLDTDKPLICAVNGFAVGGGLELALACDIRIASDNAQFGLAEVRVGSIPGAGGTQRLPRIIGESMAMQMLLTGERIDATRALEVGLVSEVHTTDGLLPRARELAERITANAPLAVNAVKHLVRRGRDMPLPEAIEMESYVWGLLRDTEDRIEGRKAFQEKRRPVYKGS